MPISPLSTLKDYFRRYKKPTQSQFWDMLDSFFHKNEKIPIDTVDTLESNLVDIQSQLSSIQSQLSTLNNVNGRIYYINGYYVTKAQGKYSRTVIEQGDILEGRGIYLNGDFIRAQTLVSPITNPSTDLDIFIHNI